MNEFFKKLGRKVTGRKGIGNTMTVVIIIAVVLLNVLAYTLTNAFSLYLYKPQVDDLSISGSTDELFHDALIMGEKVTITFCYPKEKLETHSTGSYVLETAREFEKRYDDLIDIRFVNVLTKMDDETGVIVDFSKYIKSEEDGEDTTKVDKLRQNSVIFECGDNVRIITDNSTSSGFVDFYTLDSSGNAVAYNGEEVMAAMISWVLHKNHPVAYFTQNHGETADIALTNLLTCAGYRIAVLNLRKMEIPENTGMLIISNPTSDFDRSSPESGVVGELNKIESYLENGGKLFVALDPYVKELKNLEGMLEKWGITVSGAENENGVFVRDIIRENSNAITPDGYTFIATHADNEIAVKIRDKVTAYGTDSVLISEVARLNVDTGKGAQSLLVSGKTSSTHAGGKQTDNDGEYTVAAYSIQPAKDNKTSTVFVIPTAYITATDAFLSESYSNKDFIYSTLEVLFESNPTPRGCNQINYTAKMLENLTMGKAKTYTAIILAVPTMLAAAGIIIIIRRKNR